jgi:lipoprotein NlpD
MSRTAIAGVVASLAFIAGCADLYRWPERMERQERQSGARATRAAEPAPQGHYVVKPGDTLYSIAFRNQLDYRELAVWNDIGPDYLINVGQVVRLSAPEIAGTGSIQTAPLGESSGPVAHAPAPAPAPPAGSSPPPVATLPPVAAPPAMRLPDGPLVTQWRWPTRGAVVKGFGSGAKGVDIAGDLGQPVLAAAAGKVVYSGAALKGYGELIIIKHDDVHLSAYGYNRRRLVGEGATVAAGQPIAELGLGPEQKPVLHFEIRRKGKPVDPAGYLPAR